uniref:Uncharacterized protein n=1 Tax=Lutzomyia longipalpis TaxID=7200 RepID=A0A1B0CGF5_LUTLO
MRFKCTNFFRTVKSHKIFFYFATDLSLKFNFKRIKTNNPNNPKKIKNFSLIFRTIIYCSKCSKTNLKSY